MTAPLRGLSSVADRVRRTGSRRLFGKELDRARYVHWMTQWYPESVVRDATWAAVSQMVAYASKASAFYRGRIESIAVEPQLSAASFRAIPHLSRHELVASRQLIRASAPGMSGRLHRRSGGSSGLSVQIPLDAATYCWYIAGTWRGLRWWGTDFNERGAVLLGPSEGGLHRLATRAKDWLMNWLRIPVNDAFDDHAPDIVREIGAFGPAFLYGYPSAVHRLAREIRGQRWTPARRLKVIVLTGEPVYAFQRRAIEEAFQCPVADEYGNGELGSMGFLCPEGRQLHVTVENVYLETTACDAPLDGAAGLILATQLRNYLFPLIRYETGDVGILRGTACPCGRGLPVVEVLGRARDWLEGVDGAHFARPLVERMLNELPDHLRGHVRLSHGRRGSVVLEVERNGTSGTDPARLEELGRDVFGPGWHIGVAEVGRLRRLASGKLPYFVRKAPA